MNTETEIKLRVADRRQLLRELTRRGAKLIGARVREMNTLYDTAEGDLARRGRMLRLRVERPASRGEGANQTRHGNRAHKGSGVSAVLTYKGPGPWGPESRNGRTRRGTADSSPYKIREEHEVRVSDEREAGRIMEGLGLQPCFRYEKFRTTYRLPGMRNLKVEVDETPIGLFLELEGPPREIDRAAARLGFGRDEYINKSYGALFIEGRGVGRRPSGQGEPTSFSRWPDMVFRS